MKKTAFVGSWLLLAIACGRAPEASAPQMPADEAAPGLAGSAEQQEEEPATLAEAEALLDKAKADLDRLALNEPASESAATTAAAPPPAPAPAAPSRSDSRDEPRRAEKAAEDGASAKKEASPCETACKAYSSLERASSAVCRLDTEAPAKRCERAKQIKDDAARRVSSCSCH